MLLSAFVGSQKHSAVLAPGHVVDVHSRFDRGPGGAITRVPDLDDPLVGRHDLGVQSRRTGFGRWEEEFEGVDGEAVTLVLLQQGNRGSEIVEVNQAVGRAGA